MPLCKMKTVQILKHTIGYRYSENRTISKFEKEYIKDMIIAGYSEGELNFFASSGDNGIWGWWAIKDKN